MNRALKEMSDFNMVAEVNHIPELLIETGIVKMKMNNEK